MRPRRTGLYLALGGAAALVVVAVVVALMFRGGEEPPPAAAAPSPGTVTVHAAPWGTIERLIDVGTGAEVPEASGRPTPFTIGLPPGRYRALVRNDGFGSPVEIPFEIRSGQSTLATGTFPEFDEDDLLADLEDALASPAGRARTR